VKDVMGVLVTILLLVVLFLMMGPISWAYVNQDPLIMVLAFITSVISLFIYFKILIKLGIHK